MTIAELKKKLEGYPEDAQLFFMADYRNYPQPIGYVLNEAATTDKLSGCWEEDTLNWEEMVGYDEDTDTHDKSVVKAVLFSS